MSIPSRLPLLLLLGGVSVSGVSGGALNTSHVRDCRHRSRAEVSAEKVAQGWEGGEGVDWARVECNRVCPRLSPPEEQRTCHSAPPLPPPSHHNEMSWSVLFISLCLVLGAINRLLLPSYVPYTVALLFQAIVLGIVTGLLQGSNSCPMHALQFDSNADGLVSRSEWEEFTCVGCHPESECAYRSCGDGSSLPPNCHHSFDELDSRTWKKSPLSMASFNDTVGDGMLTPDELWTVECNLLADMTGVANINPHLLLLLFLPVLLFESSFSIDMGVLLLAFVGVFIASLLTGAVIFMFKREWNFNVCWMVGTILSPTDPVAVISLLKEVGAPTSLSTIIEGEALLNDGTAIVLFVLLFNWVKHTSGPERPTKAIDNYPGGWVDLFRVIAQMCLLGPLFGWFSARMLIYGLKRVYNDKMVETSLVVASSFLTFWLADVRRSRGVRMGWSGVGEQVVMVRWWQVVGGGCFRA
ncbi:MAG: hypothetical protein SGPRY_010261 [Prymnesium sp.]